MGIVNQRWVPTGREYEERAQSPLGPGEPVRRRKLLDRVLGRNRRARTEVVVPPGVGEARAVVNPSSYRSELRGSEGAPPQANSVPVQVPPATEARTRTTAPTPATAQAPVAGAPVRKQQPRSGRKAGSRPIRRTSIREGLVPEIQPRVSTDPDARVGTWPEHLTEEQMRRQIGSTQNYGDCT